MFSNSLWTGNLTLIWNNVIDKEDQDLSTTELTLMKIELGINW